MSSRPKKLTPAGAAALALIKGKWKMDRRIILLRFLSQIADQNWGKMLKSRKCHSIKTPYFINHNWFPCHREDNLRFKIQMHAFQFGKHNRSGVSFRLLPHQILWVLSRQIEMNGGLKCHSFPPEHAARGGVVSQCASGLRWAAPWPNSGTD